METCRPRGIREKKDKTTPTKPEDIGTHAAFLTGLVKNAGEHTRVIREWKGDINDPVLRSHRESLAQLRADARSFFQPDGPSGIHDFGDLFDMMVIERLDHPVIDRTKRKRST
jgi:hypothetical protein